MQQGGFDSAPPMGDAQQSQSEASEIRRRLGTTLVFNLRQAYGAGFAPGIPADVRVGDVLARLDKPSFSQVLRYLNR
jgi:hypothetical protein